MPKGVDTEAGVMMSSPSRRFATAGCLGLAPLPLAVLTPGNHAEAAALPAPPEATYDYIVVEDLAPDGSVIEFTVTSGSDPASDHPLDDATTASDSGSGGESAGSGCRRATIYNEVETALGATAYVYNTWTQWCWRRSSHAVSDVTTGQYLSDVDPFFKYRGIVSQDERPYAWQTGYNKSGHWHERQIEMENCVYACLGSTFPRNVLRVHSDGTYTWRTYG